METMNYDPTKRMMREEALANPQPVCVVVNEAGKPEGIFVQAAGLKFIVSLKCEADAPVTYDTAKDLLKDSARKIMDADMAHCLILLRKEIYEAFESTGAILSKFGPSIGNVWAMGGFPLASPGPMDFNWMVGEVDIIGEEDRRLAHGVEVVGVGFSRPGEPMTMEDAVASGQPVCAVVGEDGEPMGVLVQAFGERFLIEPCDISASGTSWQKAMCKLKAESKDTFSLRQAEIAFVLLSDINSAFIRLGLGPEEMLLHEHWTNVGKGKAAWFIDFSTGESHGCLKSWPTLTRPVMVLP